MMVPLRITAHCLPLTLRGGSVGPAGGEEGGKQREGSEGPTKGRRRAVRGTVAGEHVSLRGWPEACLDSCPVHHQKANRNTAIPNTILFSPKRLKRGQSAYKNLCGCNAATRRERTKYDSINRSLPFPGALPACSPHHETQQTPRSSLMAHQNEISQEHVRLWRKEILFPAAQTLLVRSTAERES